MADAPGRTDEKLIVRGLIRAPHGHRGEVTVSFETDYPERVTKARTLRVRRGSEITELEVVRTSPFKGGLLVKFKGVDSREAAADLRGGQIVVPASEIPKLPEGEYYWHDLVGLKVVTTEGVSVGTIREIMRTGSNDVWVTEGPLIPDIADVVEKVDLEAGVAVIRPLPGLLD